MFLPLSPSFSPIIDQNQPEKETSMKKKTVPCHNSAVSLYWGTLAIITLNSYGGGSTLPSVHHKKDLSTNLLDRCQHM